MSASPPAADAQVVRQSPRSRPAYNRVGFRRIRWTFLGRNRTSESCISPARWAKPPCQGEGRGFGSRLPLSENSVSELERRDFVCIHERRELTITGHQLPITATLWHGCHQRL